MTVADELRECVGDPRRFGDLRERVEILLDEQISTWLAGDSGWLVMPLDRNPLGFYLLSENREGQRRGREVLEAFLGPTATVNQVTPTPRQPIDELLEGIGLRHIAQVSRRDGGSEQLLGRIEDAVTTAKGKDARLRPIRPSHVELLRDLRLALMQRNGRLADRILEDIRLTGRLSAENLRFLTIEVLGRLERWRELRDLPYMAELLRARRPRAVNEILLEMVWHTELAEIASAGQSADEMFDAVDLGSRFGSLISAVDVPSTKAGRSVGLVAALTQQDEERVQRLMLAAADDTERDKLRRIVGMSIADVQPQASTDIRDLFYEGQHGAFIRTFLQSPDAAIADLVVQATLDSEDVLHASDVLAVVKKFDADGVVQRSRRLSRDLEDLSRLANGSCDSWREWCERVARDTRWPDAASVVRSQSGHWESLSFLATAESAAAATSLLEAWSGINQDQIAASLDLLCREAATNNSIGSSNDLSDAVLLLLSEQANLSSPVREAFLLLLERILESGPSESRYSDTLDLADRLWSQVAAVSSIDWAISLIDTIMAAPTPNEDDRISVITKILIKAQTYQQRLSARQLTELSALGEECGIQLNLTPQSIVEEESPWRALDGKIVGLYSLLPGVGISLRKRLYALCQPKAFESNSDTVATGALRTLASRADVLIVDTRHASHAATNAIDAVRPRERQLLPDGRGAGSFMRALENLLTT
ncbi:protein DpdD [Lentzea sp. NPDC055074]